MKGKSPLIIRFDAFCPVITFLILQASLSTIYLFLAVLMFAESQ